MSDAHDRLAGLDPDRLQQLAAPAGAAQPRTATATFLVTLTVPEGTDPMACADRLLDWLASQDDDAPYISADGVDPHPWPGTA